MADIGGRLRIKYGLVNSPSPALQKEWADLTESLINKGHRPEVAGSEAANQLFPDVGRMLFKSEADTIEMLLRNIQDK